MGLAVTSGKLAINFFVAIFSWNLSHFFWFLDLDPFGPLPSPFAACCGCACEEWLPFPLGGFRTLVGRPVLPPSP